MSQNAKKNNEGNIEEYIFRTEKLVDILHAWQMVGNFRITGKQGIYPGLI